MQSSTKLNVTWFHIFDDVIITSLNYCFYLCCLMPFFCSYFTKKLSYTDQYRKLREVVCFSFVCFICFVTSQCHTELGLEVFMATALSVWSKTTYQYVCHKIWGKVTNFDVILKTTQSRDICRKLSGGSNSVPPAQIGLNKILYMHITIFTW